jgi:hypothetical protein
MKTLILACSLILLAGCASNATQYYEAVQKTAQANAAAAQAKFDALSKIAAAGDGQAASAAVMALALTQTPTITPVPQTSEALQWASILAAPVSNLGMMWMQTDSTKTMAKYNAQVDLARISADATTQQALYGSFVATNATTGEVAISGLTQMGTSLGNVDYTPFIDGMVTLGTAGMDSAVTLGTEGLNTSADIATAGFTQIGLTAEDGINATGNVGLAGMTNLLDLGKWGMEGIWMTNKDWLDYATANSCTITTDADGKVVVTCN